MGTALVVVLLVSAAERPDAIVPALQQGSRRDVQVIVRESEDARLDDQVVKVAKSDNARVVVDVSHPDVSRSRTTIHLHDADGSLVRQTTTDFPSSQPPKERGRALGFAIAAMIGAEDPDTSFPVAPATTAAAPTKVDVPPEPIPKAPPPEDETRFGVEVSGAALTDAKSQSGAGASFALLWRPANDFEVRLGGDARWIDSASELGARAGIAWRFARWQRVAVAVKADVLVAHDTYEVSVSRTNPNGKVLPSTTSSESKTTPGIAFGPEIEGSLFPVMSLFLAPALEITPRDLGGTRSVMWVTVNAGTRFRF